MGSAYSRSVAHSAAPKVRIVLPPPPPPGRSTTPTSALAPHKVIQEEPQVIAIRPWWSREGDVICLGVAAPSASVSVAVRPRSKSWSGCLSSSQLSRTLLSHLGGLRRSLSRQGVFGKGLQQSFAQLIDHRCTICTTPNDGHFVTGVLDRRRIPSPFYQNSAELSSASQVVEHATILLVIFQPLIVSRAKSMGCR